ncbi:hypothetical protein F4561_005234 [Lipingzhangella halophila]|uniref:Uncharacterized protein n=1 Tax=Lipingzhangella halophila TaxID=1783352 RepID=A0A7W7RLY0_9ACTN|nr:hypothetical protein [Lipingzhangella halophila]MBB4934414.1 hypothetical protein [Lipingzhangella halophila]
MLITIHAPCAGKRINDGKTTPMRMSGEDIITAVWVARPPAFVSDD